MIARVKLSVRSEPVGGQVRDWLVSEPAYLGLASHLTILIHGYNNTQQNASDSYQRFLENMRADHLNVLGTVCEFYWPGDVASLASAATYPLHVPRAIESGQRLQQYLASRFFADDIRLTIVAHSLGCRVTLECVNAIVAAGRPRITELTLCLMAAAVPIEMVGPAARLRPGARAARRSRVLFSHYDEALGWPFRRGQAMAHEPATDAVGRTGLPMLAWTDTANLTPYAHGEYWTHNESAAEFRMTCGLPTKPYHLPRRPSRRFTSVLPLPPRRKLPKREFPGR